MPELPEVQSFVNALNIAYSGKTIQKISFHRANLRVPFDVKKISQILKSGLKILEFKRRHKQLLIVTQNGALRVSLGMSGAFLPTQIAKPYKHEHVTLEFAGAEPLAYVDPRRFGFWLVDDLVQQELAQLIADPLSCKSLMSLFSSDEIKQSDRKIKILLMDQNSIGGLGNIYVLEALFLAGLLPSKKCRDINTKQWQNLAEIIPKILTIAIKSGGSSIASYRNLNGEKGGFQQHHKVYGREGLPCPNLKCTATVLRSVQAGRSSFYCPRCQK